MSQQQIIVRPLGLVTQPNKIGGFPDGALRSADGVLIRDPFIIEQAPRTSQTFGTVPSMNGIGCGPFLFVGPPGAPTAGVTQVLLLADSSTNDWRYSWLNGTTNNGNNTLRDLYSVQQNVSTAGIVTSFTARNRQFINCTRAVLAFDHIASNPTPRNAGLLPVSINNSSQSGTGGAIPVNNYAHYTAIIRRRFSDGYEIVSAPSAAIWIQGLSSTDPVVVARVSPAWHKAGDIVDVYRTRSQAFTTNTGADYYLTASATLTSSDISNTFVNIPDYTNDATLGEALYTNPGQQGEAAAAHHPPQCKVMASFKGHAFYLNCVDPPKHTVRIGVYCGAMLAGASGANAYARAHGIGTRIVTGTLTNGSPTMTGISAADMVGIVVGQQTDDSQFTPGNGVLVVSRTASSITFSQNANTSGAGKVLIISDRFEVDGNVAKIDGANSFAYLPVLTLGVANGQYVTQMLDRLLPEDFGAGITNPESVFADGLLISRWFLAEGHSNSLTLRATNGANYTPPIPELLSGVSPLTITETTRPNGFSWSEQNQPERVCPLSTGFAGLGEIYAAYSTRDALWIFASDGLWRLSGTGGSAGDGYDWRVDPVDSTLSISGPQAGCVLRDTVYAYTNRGFVSIDSSGNIRELSTGRIGDLLAGPPWSAPTWRSDGSMWAFADETHDEIWFAINVQNSGRVYVYNTLTDAFTYISVLLNTNTPTWGAYVRTSEENIFAQPSVSSVIGRSGGLFTAHTVEFQPVGGDNPFVLRHWQNVNYILAQASLAQPITPMVNGVAYASTVTPTLMGDSGQQRVTVSVLRNAPAIANQISVGFTGIGNNSSARKLYAIALDYVDMTDQRRKR